MNTTTKPQRTTNIFFNSWGDPVPVAKVAFAAFAAFDDVEWEGTLDEFYCNFTDLRAMAKDNFWSLNDDEDTLENDWMEFASEMNRAFPILRAAMNKIEN